MTASPSLAVASANAAAVTASRLAFGAVFYFDRSCEPRTG